jgi:hypothetical protein
MSLKIEGRRSKSVFTIPERASAGQVEGEEEEGWRRRKGEGHLGRGRGNSTSH